MSTYENNELTKQINTLRKKMVILGLNKGLSDPETIACSKQLDELIVQVQKQYRIMR